MMKIIRKCVVCHKYTLSEQCCNKKTVKIHPPVFKFNLRLLNYFVKGKMEDGSGIC
ncbi:MAG: nucleolar RNA-binding Nop10p family protein [Candidatus Aenigmatarchaeota archaeon]